MYIYLIKCSVYYKIGFSKNPKNRLKTVKTHNPLDVVLFATLKTDRHLDLERELHELFSNKNSKREWFELNEDDLTYLKIEYGFNFLIPINSIKNNDVKNDYLLSEVKEVRIDNNKIDYFTSYFEQIFDVNINNKKIIKVCCLNHSTDIIKKAIDSLYTQDMDSNKAYNLLPKVCLNLKESKEYPSKYLTKIIKAIFYKRYNTVINQEDVYYLEERFNKGLDINEVVKELNTKKFYLNEDDFWSFIIDKYIS